MLRKDKYISSFNFCQIRSGDLCNAPAPDTSGTDPYPFVAAVDQRPHGLEVWIESPLGPIVGMTDIIAGRPGLTADLACSCHGISFLNLPL